MAGKTKVEEPPLQRENSRYRKRKPCQGTEPPTSESCQNSMKETVVRRLHRGSEWVRTQGQKKLQKVSTKKSFSKGTETFISLPTECRPVSAAEELKRKLSGKGSCLRAPQSTTLW